MKLESLKLDKFKDSTLKKEQMFMLNGGGIPSGPGTVKGPHGASGQNATFNYGYDVDRGGYLTFHNRSNVVYEEIVKLPTLTLEPEDSVGPLIP
jgi:hypothetical protein